jgi:hypothetical protein
MTEAYNGEITILSQISKRQIKSICADGGWDSMSALVQRGRDFTENTAKWLEWSQTTTTPPIFDKDYTTVAPLARLETTVKTYDHPFSTTTLAPQFIAERCQAMNVMVDAGKQVRDDFCSDLKEVLPVYSAEKAKLWFDTLAPQNCFAENYPFVDMWKVMYDHNEDAQTNKIIQYELVDLETLKMTKPFEAFCNHQHVEFDHLKEWNAEWSSHLADIDHMQKIGLDATRLDHDDVQQHIITVLTSLNKLSEATQRDLCEVGNKFYAPSSPMSTADAEEWWIAARLTPYKNPRHFVQSIARSLDIQESKKVISLNSESNRGVLKAFTSHYAESKDACKGALADVNENLASGIWNEVNMKRQKEKSKRLSFLMRTCHRADEVVDKTTRKLENFGQCDHIQNWKAQTTVGWKNSDMSLDEISKNLAYCYDDVTARMAKFYNKRNSATENAEEYCKMILDNYWDNGSVKLGDFAYWEYETTHPWFECLEQIRYQYSFPTHHDSNLQACDLLSQVESEKFQGLEVALADVEEADMKLLRENIKEVYGKQLVSSENGWVTVTKMGKDYSSEPLPSVKITATRTGDAEVNDFKLALQQKFNIGLATSASKKGDELTALYDKRLDEVEPRLKWLQELQKDGMEGFSNVKVHFPDAPDFAKLHANWDETLGNGKPGVIEYKCAMKNSFEEHFEDYHIQEKAVAGAEEDNEVVANAKETSDAKPADAEPAQTEGVPATEASNPTSSSSKYSLVAGALLGFALA